uniref:Uncharacterized protein n=1 Tax=Ascaris lumbricoides TaxID=6252 RepID=A0A0M3I7A8_ASCLU
MVDISCSVANKNARYCGRARKRIGVELAGASNANGKQEIDGSKGSPLVDSNHVVVELANAGGLRTLRRLRRHPQRRRTAHWQQK